MDSTPQTPPSGNPQPVAPRLRAEPSSRQDPLREELDHIHRELARTRAALEAARDAQDRFLSGVSHELRTPLSAVLLWTTLIEEEKLYQPEQLKEAVDAIKRSAEELQALIENLVDTTRVVSGRIRLSRRPAEIAPIVAAAIAQVQPAAQKKQISVHESVDPASVKAPIDSGRLQQALVHLLQNAVKYSSAGAVRVSARVTDGEMQISVTDSGAGFSADRAPHLFSGPTGVHTKAPRTETGLGYGLLVVRRIAEAHGGAVSAASAGENRGATFVLRLPLDASQPVHAEPVGSAAPLRGRHVLLVVDDPDIRQSVATALARGGAQVSAVDSAPAAAEACERRRADAIVCDLALPTIDAGELLRQIRSIEEDQHAPRAPAFALFVGSGDAARPPGAEREFDELLQMPVDGGKLVAAIAARFP